VLAEKEMKMFSKEGHPMSFAVKSSPVIDAFNDVFKTVVAPGYAQPAPREKPASVDLPGNHGLEGQRYVHQVSPLSKVSGSNDVPPYRGPSGGGNPDSPNSHTDDKFGFVYGREDPETGAISVKIGDVEYEGVSGARVVGHASDGRCVICVSEDDVLGYDSRRRFASEYDDILLTMPDDWYESWDSDTHARVYVNDSPGAVSGKDLISRGEHVRSLSDVSFDVDFEEAFAPKPKQANALLLDTEQFDAIHSVDSLVDSASSKYKFMNDKESDFFDK
jgi:hypothetical protein